MGYCSKYVNDYGGYLYLVFRVLMGVLFFMHGWIKFAGSSPVAVGSLFGVAGIIELVAGVLIVLGVFTRGVAIVTAVEMVVAWFMVHAPQGWNPLTNGGELAVLYFVAFLVMIVHGNGKWNLEQTLLGKEMF